MVDTIVNSFDIWTNAQGIKSRTRVKSVDNISLEGIEKLRSLILKMALRGELTTQDPNDEPADTLIKRIEKERSNRKEISILKIKVSEKPFVLPKGWEWIRLQQIIQISSGNGLTAAEMKSDGKIPVFGGNGINGYHDKENVSEPTLVIGRVGFYCGSVHITPSSAWVTDNAFITSFSKDNIYINFLSWLLKGTNLKENEGATAQPVISGRKVYPIVIAFPPLAEQQRIIAKVDELMALCDKLEEEQFNNLKTHQVLVKTLLETLTQAADANELQAAWERMSAHFDTLFCTDDSIDQLKQTILQLAVMGKLVKQDPNDEPASELVKKIAKEKDRLVNEKKLKKQKPLSKIVEETKPFNIPNSWIWVPWGSILAYDDYPFKRGPFGSSLKKDMFIESGYKVYEQYCPINDDCSYERYYISDALYKSLEGFAVKADDYLVSCSGATLGRITQVPSNFKEGIINQALLRVRMNHNYVDKDFFKLLFRSPYFQKLIFDNSTGSAIPNVKGVNELKAMPVPFLPLEEQQKILKKVEELYSICDKLKERVLKSQKIKGLLSKTIIEKAVQ